MPVNVVPPAFGNTDTALLLLGRYRERDGASEIGGTELKLRYDSSNNTLQLTLDDERRTPAEQIDLAGYVEMGTGGRLAGVELLDPGNDNLPTLFTHWIGDQEAGEYLSVDGNSAYIELSESDALNEPTRTAAATFRADLNSDGQVIALSIPRHGNGYEITYPSGNQ
ncbi:MAG TPA: DUF2283 domain-containing protein [Nitrolancea sp.]